MKLKYISIIVIIWMFTASVTYANIPPQETVWIGLLLAGVGAISILAVLTCAVGLIYLTVKTMVKD